MKGKGKFFSFCFTFALIVVTIVIAPLQNSYLIKKVVAAENWIYLEPYGENGAQSYEVYIDKIIQTGTHNAASDDSIHYATKEFWMTKQQYDLFSSFYSGANAEVNKKILSVQVNDKGVDNNNIKTTDYIIDRQEFINVAAKLGITGEYVYNHNGATVYLSNVFRIMQGDDVLDDYVWGYPAMLEAAAWSEKTKENLKWYYNFPYHLNNVAFAVKIIAVTKDGTLLDNNLYDTKKIYTEPIEYQLPDFKQSMTKNSTSYEYSGTWLYEYTPANGTNKTIVKGLGGRTINMEAPDAEPLSAVTIKLIYEPKEEPGPTSIPTISVTPYPTSIPNISVTPIPSSVPTPPLTPTPTLTPVITPVPDSAFMNFTTAVNTGVLRADIRGAERFIAPLGVPTTESIYGQVTAKEYLLGYRFVKKVGKEPFTVNVTRNYVLKWYSATPDKAGGKVLVTETVPVTQQITIERSYGYWEIENFECYSISNAVLNNYALPNGSITLYPNYSYYSPPSVNIYHSENLSYHITPPDEAVNGILLPDVTIIAGAGQLTHKPSIPQEDFTYQANQLTGQAKVRNDYLSFNGNIVMSDTMALTEAPDLNLMGIAQCLTYTNENTLYKPDNLIEATKKNGTYQTQGSITYTKVAKVGSPKPDTLQYGIEGLNPVVIHTPVVCIPTITADNDPYVQLIDPAKNCVELVLDPDPTLSDFTVNISNIGYHSGKQGYFSRDFSMSFRNPSVSYVSLSDALLMNQVKFPFDVYIDAGIAYDRADDDFIKADTWITIGRNTPRFYLPMAVNEGIYAVNFRTVAVNGASMLTDTEDYANTQLGKYVATNTVKVEVSGRIYGLTVYDLSDYPPWEDVFRVEDSMDFKKDSAIYEDGTGRNSYLKNCFYTYTLGTANQYGYDTGRNLKFTFPLVNGSHPRYKNIGILKTGYVIRFSLETVGNMFSDACMVSIKPSFYYVDADGSNRRSVDLYYSEAINNKSRDLVKIGSALDQINMKSKSTGDLYLGIPDKELRQTATLRGMPYGKFISAYSDMFTFSELRLNWAFRTYTNNKYLNGIKEYESFQKLCDDNISEGDILERIQRWYGEYYLPNEIHAVSKGFDVMDYADKYGVDYGESFWLKGGYIIVNFAIETIGEDGSRRLSYINHDNYMDHGNCSMWLLESPVLNKTSFGGTTFHFYAGDFVVYYSDKKVSDDFSTGAIY